MKVFFYQKDGKSPVEDFLRSLPASIRARFRFYLKHLEETKGVMQGVMFKKLYGYPLEEIRVKESKRLHRVIIKTRIGDSILVLHGFTKKEGEPPPQKELEIAYNRLLTVSAGKMPNDEKNKK